MGLDGVDFTLIVRISTYTLPVSGYSLPEVHTTTLGHVLPSREEYHRLTF